MCVYHVCRYYSEEEVQCIVNIVSKESIVTFFFINSWRECEVFFKTSKDNSKVFVHSVVKCFTNIDN